MACSAVDFIVRAPLVALGRLTPSSGCSPETQLLYAFHSSIRILICISLLSLPIFPIDLKKHTEP